MRQIINLYTFYRMQKAETCVSAFLWAVRDHSRTPCAYSDIFRNYKMKYSLRLSALRACELPNHLFSAKNKFLVKSKYEYIVKFVI